MYRNKQNQRVSLASIILVVCLATIYTACTPGQIPIPPIFAPAPGATLAPADTTIPAPQTAVPATEAPTAVPLSATPASEPPATATAIEEMTPTPAPETPTPVTVVDAPASEPSPAAVEEEAPSALDPSQVAVPADISHRLRGREDCLECHEAETGKEAAPADHQGLTITYCLFCHTPAEGKDAVPPLPADANPDFCLGCHSPYEELIALTKDSLVDEEGVTGNPHGYIPHTSTNIIACDACHDVHTLPVTPLDEIPQASAQYCYRACHHEENFEPCQSCHEDDAAGE